MQNLLLVPCIENRQKKFKTSPATISCQFMVFTLRPNSQRNYRSSYSCYICGICTDISGDYSSNEKENMW